MPSVIWRRIRTLEGRIYPHLGFYCSRCKLECTPAMGAVTHCGEISQPPTAQADIDKLPIHDLIGAGGRFMPLGDSPRAGGGSVVVKQPETHKRTWIHDALDIFDKTLSGKRR